MGMKPRPIALIESTIRPPEMREKTNNTGRRRARRESWRQPVIEKATKIDLRRLVLKASGGFRGRNGGQMFATELLRCFGWPEIPEGVESPCSLSIVDHGKRSARQVALWWPERRTLIEAIDRDASPDQAWQDLLRACLQLDPVPQYVVLSNQRELRLYDLARDRDAPRLDIAIDQLPKYSEAFPFLAAKWTPGVVPKIINVDKVSEKVADLVAKLYRSLIAGKDNEQADVIRFTLQCIIAMFAEDIGFFPSEYFTTLLYEGTAQGDVEVRLAELFVQMNVQYGSSPEIPYFNGGLFEDPVVLPLGEEQLRALTKAAEANWSYVEPHIFGSVFQGIMDDEERHASGGHYTARDDIMRIVGPTIVEPWRARITGASALGELQPLLKELSEFRVLDPACGSGNFLYVAFRELYRLETELLSRMYEFASVKKSKGRNRRGWGSSIRITNFYGMDINPFAVELAKTTLNMAKKIAFDERNETVAAMYGQLEMEIDKSLPLDNLEDNIVCKDALFREWPDVDAIIGNPPFLSGSSISSHHGQNYAKRLATAFSGVHGRTDLCAYWFRLAHDNLPKGGRAGLIGTSSVRDSHTCEASLAYIVSEAGTITDAVSSQPWPGQAAVNVSIVNWLKGQADGSFRLTVKGQVYDCEKIEPHLQLHTDVREAKKLKANRPALCSEGVHMGTKACQTDPIGAAELRKDPAARPYVRPVAQAKDLLGGKISRDPDYMVDMSSCADIGTARSGGSAFDFLEAQKLPVVEQKSASFSGWLEHWWQAWRPRRGFYREVEGKQRFIACSKHAARPVFVFLSSDFIPTHSLQVFAFDDDYSFGVLQSMLHWHWVVAQGGKIKADPRYSSKAWTTFPWPQDVDEEHVESVCAAGRRLRALRSNLMSENDWSLRALHRAAALEGPHPLKAAQAELDKSVSLAYGIPPGQELMAFLLELNQCLAEDEDAGIKVQGPGLPDGLDAADTRWGSNDCIAVPPLVGD